MRCTEIDVIIKYGATLASIVKKGIYLGTDDRIESKETAEKHDVIGINLRIDIVYAIVGMVFIENIVLWSLRNANDNGDFDSG